jgi:hypothetical protein
LTDGEHARIGDFGLALRHVDQIGKEGELAGTPAYMSPEQIAGKALDGRSDIWSLGVVFYEMLTGTRPFKGDTHLAKRIAGQNPWPIQQHNRKVPPALSEICMRCLEKSPKDRHASAGDLASVLHNYLTHSDCPRPRPVRGHERSREHWMPDRPVDKHYVAPELAVRRFHEYLATSSVRIVAVTGIGGVGKTAFLAHNFKGKADQIPRDIRGVFYWDFNSDPDYDRFLESLLLFGTNMKYGGGTSELDEAAAALLQWFSLVLILDGLERYHDNAGALDVAMWPKTHRNIKRLSRLLEVLSESDTESLVCLASRLPIPALSDIRDDSVHHVTQDLLQLTLSESLSLLTRLRVKERDRESPSLHWCGHPLGLRSWACHAASANREYYSSAIEKIASFYEQNLARRHVVLLRVLSLFCHPLPAEVVIRFAREVPSFCEELDLDEHEILCELRALCNDGLLMRITREHQTSWESKQEHFLCHPVLRKHLSQAVYRLGVLKAVADEKDLNGSYAPADHAAIQAAVIHTLLEHGEIAQADHRFRTQLHDGDLFRETEVPIEIGKSCADAFVCDESRLERCKEVLTTARVVHYLRIAGLFSLLSGDRATATEHFSKAVSSGSFGGELEILLNMSLVQCVSGNPRQGEAVADQSLSEAVRRKSLPMRQHSLSCRAFSRFVQGRTHKASRDFRKAIRLGDTSCKPPLSSKDLALYGMFLMRAGSAKQIRKFIRQLRGSKTRSGTPDPNSEDAIYRDWLLGCALSHENKLDKATECLARAALAARSQGFSLLEPSIACATADTYRKILSNTSDPENRQKPLTEVLRRCRDACFTAASQNLELARIDLIVVELRARLEELTMQIPIRTTSQAGESQSISAKDATAITDSSDEAYLMFEREYGDIAANAEMALDAARKCEYRWQEKDILQILADLERVAAKRYKVTAKAFQAEADSLEQRLSGQGS